MRFLHTADWHLGRTMRGRSRAAEFEAVFAELAAIVRAERIDVMLVCGDIWDTASPAPESDRLLYEALREFIGLRVQVVLIAGNHDSPRKLEALGRLSDLLGVYTQPYVKRPDGGGVLPLRAGEEVASIAAIPWIPEGRLIDAEEVLGPEAERHQQYADRAAAIYRASCAGLTPETINIVAGHLFVDGARLAATDRSERLLHIGRAYGVNAAALPSTPQYIALGHIHRPQPLAAVAAPAAYSGSLLQLDFGELGQQKSVRIVDAHPGRPVEQRELLLSAGRPLVELRGSLDAVLARAQEVAGAYVRVRLEMERPEPGLAQRVRDAIPLAVEVRLEFAAAPEQAPGSQLAHLSPAELFARYYRSQHGAEPAPELLVLFARLFEEATRLETGAIA
ncbi:MAG: exonuclease SbcCD subunit D [Dehalococcoidia bacterium]|nr:exonuclease SbcCD subunit D [Dehalococcoidia bacterium]